MTTVVAGVGVVLAVLFAGFVRDLGVTSSLRAQAQLAADAAALAAVAESAPYGGGRRRQQAAAYARKNGARLLHCSCPDASTASEVTVAVSDVVAEARAVLDPEALLPASVAFDSGGLNPFLADAVRRLIDASRGRIRLISGYRSSEAQSVLWERALERYGSSDRADDWVAPPGHSMHQRGLAVDLGGDLAMAVRLIKELELPMWRPLHNEPWHFELVGSRG